jgi:hypothetical protein
MMFHAVSNTTDTIVPPLTDLVTPRLACPQAQDFGMEGAIFCSSEHATKPRISLEHHVQLAAIGLKVATTPYSSFSDQLTDQLYIVRGGKVVVESVPAFRVALQ